MYKVRTTKGIIYNKVKSWKLWELNAAFCEFEWEDSKKFIIRFEDIESIEMV